MKKFALLLLSCLVSMFSGCGKEPNRSVTDGVDLDAIRAYEESLASIAKQEKGINLKEQAIAEEKAAAAILKSGEETKKAP